MKKKIAILATYVGEVDRGAETLAIEFTKKFIDIYDITLYSKGIADEIKKNTVKINIKIPYWLLIHRKLYNNFKLYNKICSRIYYLIPDEIEQFFFNKEVYKKHLSKEKFDLIFPINGIWGVKAAVKIRKKFGTPFIYTGCGGSSLGEIKILNLKPNTYFCLDNNVYNWAVKQFKDILKTTLAVNPEDFGKEIKLKVEDENLEKPIVLCVAAFTKMKRQKLLIDAMVKVNRGTLILIGNGEMKREIEEYGKEMLKNKIIIKSVSYKDLSYYYGLCDLFSLPSLGEAGGTVLFESLASNKPIVSTDDSLRKEVVGDAGILCNVEDSTEYANAIIECYSKNWGNIPRERAINNFSWEKIAKDYEKVIEKITS